jgi:Ni/Fe-hydrogenase subunit HybB-like protein
MGEANAADQVASIVSAVRAPRSWYWAFAVSAALALLLLVALAYLLVGGVGIWGLNVPVSWGFAIVNFVWWIGIAHAGTLISAILLLFRQRWRKQVSRFAETMTVFAVLCAALFPLIHLGRPWLFYWLFPYPGPTGAWPQFRSPLVWDVFAIGTYGIVSVLFWYGGMVPDLAVLRDRARSTAARKAYGALALGWRGQADHWQRYETGYRLLAGLATALVVSVHSIVSFDFAVSNLPGWHSTIFPPYFVAGAMFSGFAMLLALLIPVRAVYGLERLITIRHVDNMAKVMLVTGLVVAYGYCTEIFAAIYSGDLFAQSMLMERLGGRHAPVFWAMLLANVAAPQLLWSPRVRQRQWVVFGIAVVVAVGMWLERYVIVVTSLASDFLPSSWGAFAGTFWDWATLAGSLGLFGFCISLFMRRMPMVSMVESGLDDVEPTTRREPGEPSAGGETRAVLGEFRSAEGLLRGVEELTSGGYEKFEAYTPHPVPGLPPAATSLPKWTFLAGMLGAAAGFALQYWVSAVEVASNVGGRPLNSWQAFIPVTFECAILSAALVTAIGMFAGSGLPRLNHPVFNTPNFSLARGSRYYLCVSVLDPLFDRDKTRILLASAGAEEVVDIAS